VKIHLYATPLEIVIGLAILLIVAIYGGPIIALPLAIAVVAVYLLVRRSRSA
jgi:hypothetical protein